MYIIISKSSSETKVLGYVNTEKEAIKKVEELQKKETETIADRVKIQIDAIGVNIVKEADEIDKSLKELYSLNFIKSPSNVFYRKYYDQSYDRTKDQECLLYEKKYEEVYLKQKEFFKKYNKWYGECTTLSITNTLTQNTYSFEKLNKL